MTRSIFDPTSGDAERSGSSNMGPAANNLSKMPADVVDGKVGDEEVTSSAEVDAAHAGVNEVALNDEEAAERLAEMQRGTKTDPD